MSYEITSQHEEGSANSIGCEKKEVESKDGSVQLTCRQVFFLLQPVQVPQAEDGRPPGRPQGGGDAVLDEDGEPCY